MINKLPLASWTTGRQLTLTWHRRKL